MSVDIQPLPREPTEPLRHLAPRIALTLLAFVLVDRALLYGLRLPETTYQGPIIALAALRQPRTLAGAASLAAIVGLLRWRHPAGLRRLLAGWGDDPDTASDRRFAAFLTTLLVYLLLSSSKNAYFGQAYVVDRLLIVALAVAAWFRPVAIIGLVAVGLMFRGQADHPFTGYSASPTALIVRILTLYWVVHAREALLNTGRRRDFVFLAGCAIAGFYWLPGYLKIPLNWMVHGHVEYLLPAAHASGWLNTLDVGTVEALTRGLASLSTPIKVFTLMVEWGALLLFARWTTARLMVVGWIAFHAGIFATCGIFFWAWSLVDAAFLGVYLLRRERTKDLFDRAHLVVSVVVIALYVWLRPVGLAWIEAPVTYTYHWSATGRSGRQYALPPDFFDPYDYPFRLSSFHDLTEGPTLPIFWGVTFDSKITDALRTATSAEGIFAIERRLGADRKRGRGAQRIEDFARTFVRRRSEQRPGWWTRAAAPPLVVVPAGEDAYDWQEPLQRVRVVQTTTWFDGEKIRRLKTKLVSEIEL